MGLLDTRAEKRDDLLLAEIAALLHNLGKLSDRFLAYQLKDDGFLHYEPFGVVAPSEFSSELLSKLSTIQYDLDKATKQKIAKDQWIWSDLHPVTQQTPLRETSLHLLEEAYYFYEVLGLWHLYGSGAFQDAMPRDLLGKGRHGYGLWLIDVCHGIMQIEKGSGAKDKPHHNVYVSTAFGYENQPIPRHGQDSLSNLLSSLDLTDLKRKILQERTTFLKEIKSRFSRTVADTQRPINEITLWDWCQSVATLFKTLLAQAELQANSIRSWIGRTSKDDRSIFRWRTLRVTVDVLGQISRAHHLSDVLGRKETLLARFDRVKHLMEEEYPLGNEIYRDSTGIYFTFPDVDDKDDIDALCSELEPLIRERMTDNGSLPELTPIIAIGDPWHEDKKRGWSPDMARRLLAVPRTEASLAIRRSAFAGASVNWQSLWPAHSSKEDASSEICPVCQLRPVSSAIGEIPYRVRRCGVCETLRRGALEKETEEKEIEEKEIEEKEIEEKEIEEKEIEEKETIWLDEIADEHARVALVVGRFDLDQWLDGTFINTLAAGKPANGRAELKHPSPARIMRIWRTAQEFWEITIKQQFKDYYQQSQNRHQRYRATVTWDANKSPTPQEYLLDGTAGGFPVSLLREHGQEWSIVINPALAGIEPNRPTKTVPLSVRQENGNWHTGILTITNQATPYQPTRTILTSPDQFLALVPAADALAIANAIAKRYGEEFGKVRSRLPLDLALVYFHRKMPLYAVIDAARRFLTEPSQTEERWKVTNVTPDRKSQRAKISFDNGVEWDVSTCFGDGSEDNFYPYIGLWDTNAQGDYRANGRGYVHVKHVADKEVAVAPSRFSYLWLDTSTRRYAIGEREDEAPFVTQGMYLEEIAQLIEMWETLQKHHDGKRQTTDSTLHGVIELLLEKQQSWKVKAEDELFARFATDVLARSGLAKIGITTADVTSGRLFRCFDLHYRIMKQRLAPQKQPAETTQHQSDEKEIAHQ